MTDNEIAQRDIHQAFPADGSAPNAAARLNCLCALYEHYSQFFVSPVNSLGAGDWVAAAHIATIETEWNRYEQARVTATDPELPTTAEEFRDWFEAVAAVHEYPDICDFLRNEASLLDIAFFVHGEGKVEGNFDDLMALAQIGSPMVTKLTIARNYWDEMGNGDHDAAHTVMLERTIAWLLDNAVRPGFELDRLEIAEVYANACEVLMYLLNRRYLLRGLGSLGLLERTAPARFAATVDGLRRLGVPDPVFRYQSTHVVIDADHSREWVDGVFTPIIKENPDTIPELAMGVLIRGNVASEFFHQIRQDLAGLG
jgi:hypothetical protein